MIQSKEYKIYCKICDKECTSENRINDVRPTYRCDGHYMFRPSGSKFVEILWRGPYSFIKIDGWKDYEVWCNPSPEKYQWEEKFLFRLNLDKINFKNEKYVVDKIKSLHIFS